MIEEGSGVSWSRGFSGGYCFLTSEYKAGVVRFSYQDSYCDMT